MSGKTCAAALAGGYLLGRTKKMKLAVVVGSAVMGRRLKLNPQELLGKGLKALGSTPEFERLNEQVRGDLAAAARHLAAQALDRRLGSLADSLHERTESLTETGQDEEEEEERDEGGEGGEEEPRRSRGERGGRGPAKKTSERRPSAGNAPAKKAAKKSPSKKAPPPGGRSGRRR